MRLDYRLARLAPLALICIGLALGACTRSSPAPVVFGGSTAKPEKAAPKPVQRPQRLAIGSPAETGKANRQGTVRISAGDTLYSIARRHRVVLRDLIERNRLVPPYRLREGQTLTLPKVRIHRVVAGDTLHAIARRHGIDMYTVAAVNRIEPPYTIRVGQYLRLPDRGPAVAADVAASSPARTATPALPAPRAGAKPNPTSRARASKSSAGFLWPLRGPIISRFGPKAGGLHNDGINIAASAGAPIVAANHGIVAYAGNELRGFGNLLLVRHAGGWTTAYAHTDRLLVQRGDRVKKGEVIARAGTTGRVQRPQLHFELRKGADAVDPLQFLVPAETSG